MGRSQESFKKKEVRTRKEKKKKAKEQKRLAKKEDQTKGSQDDMIAYVDEFGRITSSPPDPTKKEEIELEDIEISPSKLEPGSKANPIRQGTVTLFNDSKGFGFIKDSETKESIFVHISEVEDDIQEGNLVEFEVVKGDRGPAATKVKIVK